MFKVAFYPHSLPTSSKLDDFNISGSISDFSVPLS